ncbi:hypothetical protein NVP1017O_34 [Vibrio phage 1.017.O._10N.286.55.C11]|nr:hypothetical protein NVP1017O_34 [Vibrio phage 1.017.O._10N.286.55.C11]AUR85466.1 hypothetical protein NVP1075O_34 [Vibrio phage 1.075.O._10N.286.55.B10]AUR87012.1 hypothetical protein NVP1093O_34 [Vibrio phage 1.093.O._10N.286.55.E10]AUR87085.1 hypothetical protein NVP1094O_34 [Vibrio phage 1.094.O._10N.286.55.E12]
MPISKYPIGGGGSGFIYPESASNPFSSNSARNTWANNNKQDLIKDTTAINVGGSQWYLWTGESNPDSVSSSLWMDADQIVQGGKGDTGARGSDGADGSNGTDGIDVTTAIVDGNGDLIVTLSDGSDINAGRARGEDGDLVYQQLPAADYANFFDADWANLGTNIYGVTALGNQFANTPFPLNPATTYSFECLLVNEPNQYSLRVTSMGNADFDNSGRDAILAGTTKTAAESIGWKVYAFTSDAGHTDPSEGFDLQPDADIGLDSTSAITIKNNDGDVHNAIDQDVNLDAIRLGSPVMRTYLRTGAERMQVQTTDGMKDIAHLEDIPTPANPEAPSRFAYWIREPEYVLSEDEIQQEVMLMIQPESVVGDDRVCTVTFPSQATFTNHYYIPGVSPAGDESTKPHIESFRFSIWLYYYTSAANPVKIIMNSTGSWLPFVSSESLSETDGVYLYKENAQSGKTELHTFAFMRPVNFNPTVGVNGWSFQNVHPYDWIPLNDAPPQSPPVSLLANFMINDDESSHLRTGTGIESTFDPLTGEHTLTVDPTNIDLTGYAELDTGVSFSKVTVQNATDPLYNSVVNVTNGGNTEANLVGTTNIRKVDKTTGDTTDVISINGTSGAVDIKTDATYQGAITDDKAPVTKEYLEAFGRGIGVPAYVTVEGGNTYQQAVHVAAFENSGTDINDVVIQIDDELLESETIITMPADGYVTTKRFEVYQAVQNQGTSKDIKSGDTWRVRHVGQEWFWEKIYAGGGNIVYGLGGRNDIVTERSVKLFAYREGMPEHLLIETPSSSRLVHEFPRNKTFRFTPINSDRQHDGNVLLSQGNQGVANNDLELGQYSDIPLYIIEPNVVVNRDQRAWINFPASIGIDVSAGFYAFGTVSGWCGNSTTEGGVAVYVGTSENFRSYTQNIGFVLGNTGLYLLDGQNLRTPDNNTAMAFNIEPGVTHMYRYALYVDATGMMNYYIVDLNTGQVSQGTQQCNLASIGSDPKLYVSYDRYSNSTAAIAIAETHLVVNSTGVAEDRWNWRN